MSDCECLVIMCSINSEFKPQVTVTEVDTPTTPDRDEKPHLCTLI